MENYDFAINADVLAPHLSECFGGFFIWVASLLAGDRPMSRQYIWSTVLLCCQLQTDFHNISTVDV